MRRFHSIPLWLEDPRIDLMFFDVGGGHRASAFALKSVLDREHPSWQVRMVNLRDVLEPLDIIRRVTRVRIEDIYNRILLQRGFTIGTGAMLRATQMLIRGLHGKATALLGEFWKGEPSDMVVSLIPNFNRAIFEGLRAADAGLNQLPTPMATILTDWLTTRLTSGSNSSRNLSSAAPQKPQRRRARWDIRRTMCFKHPG